MPIGSVDWIADDMLSTELRRSGPHTYAFDIRNQFFHGTHPLGWIRSVEVHVDGAALDPADVSFVLRGQSFRSDELCTFSDVWWQPRELAALSLHLRTPPERRELTVRCRFNVSTFFFTPMIDVNGVYPVMTLDLSADMTIVERPAVAS